MKNLASVVLSFFKGSSGNQEDQSLVAELQAFDELDEATAYAVLLTEVARSDGRFDKL